MKQNKITSSLFLLLLVSLLIRGTVLFSNPKTFNDDPDAYAALATNLKEYGVFGLGHVPTAFRPPLYPALLKHLTPLQTKEERPGKSIQNRGKENTNSLSSSGFDNLKSFFYRNLALSPTASIILLHWILGVATVFLVRMYARNCGLPEKYAAWSALLVVFDPILLQQSRFIMTETLAAFFTALLLWATTFVVKNRTRCKSFVAYATLGVFFGLSALCRPTFYLFTAFVLINLFIIEVINPQPSHISEEAPNSSQDVLSRSQRRRGVRILRLVCFVLGLSLAVIPWGYRNYKNFGIPIVTTTHGGYTLYLANNPELYSHYETDSAFSLWDPNGFHSRRLRDYENAVTKAKIKRNSPEEELFQNAWNKEQALNTISSDPPMFSYSTMVRIFDLWRVLPHDVPSASTNKNFSSKISPSTRETTNRVGKLGHYGVAIFYSVEFLILLFGTLQLILSRRNSKKQESIKELFLSPYVWGIWLILSIQIPHLFYWTNMRMRAPIQVVLPVIILGLIYRFRSGAGSTNKKTS